MWTHRETARILGGTAFDRLLEEGEDIELAERDGRPARRIEVYHTPGHAPGHLCFLDRVTGACAVGDMVAGVGWILIDPYDGDMTSTSILCAASRRSASGRCFRRTGRR